jgi:RNA polymerase sigma factor (sigma-70 family)
MRGGTVSAWSAAILAGVLGSTIGFERMGAGTAAGGHATAGHRAGASAAPPPLTAPGGNWPPNQQGQQQGPNEEPRPSQPTKPVRQPSAKTGRKKDRSDRDQGPAEVVRGAPFAATAGHAEATTSTADLATPPMGVATEPSGRRVRRGQVSRSIEPAEDAGVPDTDAALLERWRAHRNEAAFGSLMFRHRPAVLSYARGFTDEDTAQDLVAMAFEHICAQPIEVKDAAHLRARLRRVVRGHAVDQARKLGRLVLLDPDWFDGQSQTPQPEPRWYRLELLEASMAMLSPCERQILQWRYVEGIGCAEIAARLGVPLRSVQRKVTVARRRLKAAAIIVEKSWRVLPRSNV